MAGDSFAESVTDDPDHVERAVRSIIESHLEAVAYGAHIKTLMARMGDASPRAALHYQHAPSDQGIATALSSVFIQAKQDAAAAPATSDEAAVEAGCPRWTLLPVARNGLYIVS